MYFNGLTINLRYSYIYSVQQSPFEWVLLGNMTLTTLLCGNIVQSERHCPESFFAAFPVDPARMRIRKPKTVTLTQLAVVTAVGIVGGVYIYKPLFEKFWFGGDSRKKPETTAAQEASG